MKLTFFISSILASLFAFGQETKPSCFDSEWSPKINISGYIEVPEDYSLPISSTNQVRLFYYGRIAKGTDPVMFFNGGPGGSSHYSSEQIFAKDDSGYFSFIFMDQRGTGCSTNYIENQNEEGIKKLSLYTADNIVRDAEEVRKKLLGEKKWKIFGQSYGSLIVHHYIQLFPESIISAHAHGFALMSNPIDWFVERLLSSQRVYNEFKTKNPIVDERLEVLSSKLDSSICFEKDFYKICGSSILDPLVRYVAYTTSWPLLSQWANAMLNPDDSLNLPNIQSFFEKRSYGFYRFTGFGARSVIPAIDILGGYSHAQGCRLAEKKLQDRGYNPSDWLLNECRILKDSADPNWENLILQNLTIKNFGPEKIRPMLIKYPDLKLYLYSGDLDSFVPSATFHEETQVLGDLVSYTHFMNSGHEGYLTEPLVWENLKK